MAVQTEEEEGKGGASGAERPSSNPTLSFSGESSLRSLPRVRLCVCEKRDELTD